MTLLIVIGFLMVTNFLTLFALYRLQVLNSRQVDKLTNKIQAPELAAYTSTKRTTTVGPADLNSNRIKENPFQAIDEASPEEVMFALAKSVGRGNEYERGEE